MGLALVLAAGFFVFGLPLLREYNARSESREERARLERLAQLLTKACADDGGWDALVPAGPRPPSYTGKKQDGRFARDPVFARIGFDPGAVRYVYQVRTGHLSKSGRRPIEISAEGDFEGDGSIERWVIHCDHDCACGHVSRRMRWLDEGNVE